jgi:hypothetical protein
MAKNARKMAMKGRKDEMSSSSDTNDESGSSESSSDEASPKTRVKKVMVKETFAKGGMVRSNGCVMAGRGGSYKGTK